MLAVRVIGLMPVGVDLGLKMCVGRDQLADYASLVPVCFDRSAMLFSKRSNDLWASIGAVRAGILAPMRRPA